MSYTMVDVAKRAEVSIKTVSRVINGEKYVRQSTKRKVNQAISELGYKTNQDAVRLRRKDRLTYVFLIPHDYDNWFEGFFEALAKQHERSRVKFLPLRIDLSSDLDINSGLLLIKHLNPDGVLLWKSTMKMAKLLNSYGLEYSGVDEHYSVFEPCFNLSDVVFALQPNSENLKLVTSCSENQARPIKFSVSSNHDLIASQLNINETLRMLADSDAIIHSDSQTLLQYGLHRFVQGGYLNLKLRCLSYEKEGMVLRNQQGEAELICCWNELMRYLVEQIFNSRATKSKMKELDRIA